jgi:hypothetical protein
VEGCGRHVPEREIRAAVEDALECAWQPSGATGQARVAPSSPKWPPCDEKRRAGIITEAPFPLADLFDISPMTLEGDEPGAEWFVDELFPGNPLLCIGKSNSDFHTANRESFRGTLSGMPLLVPSPMSALLGKKKNPKPGENPLSAHTLDNTGPRRYLVTEFDSGTPDEQSAIIHHLSGFAPLVMVLSSGGKSLHAWWRCWGATEDAQLKFFRYAVSLGADVATWTRSQFVRMPMGWRADKGRRQEVYYFNHELAGEGQAQ